MTIEEAVQAFLEEEDERVVRPVLDRIARVLAGFLEYSRSRGVTEAGGLSLDHVEGFLRGGPPARRTADLSDALHSVKQFLKWLQWRKQAPKLYDEFCARQSYLKGELAK